MAPVELRRDEVGLDGTTLSVLTAGDPGAEPLLLLHGTFWSRVWQPVLPGLGAHARCLALDFPGFGRSGGELSVEQATAPALARTALRAADALGLESFHLAAHDIGGAVAQYLAVHHSDRVRSMVLMNAVMFDSWPVPAVVRFRDPDVRDETSVEELVQARGTSLDKAVARDLSAQERRDYLSPWHEPTRARSWMAMAAAADASYTLDLVSALTRLALPTLLVWGRDDEFQKVQYARRYVTEIAGSRLVEVPGAHIPTEDSPDLVTRAVHEHLAAALT